MSNNLNKKDTTDNVRRELLKGLATIPILGIFEGSSNQTAVGITPGDDVIFGISTKTKFISF